MAPPVNRRSGYSRRAQYGTFFGYIAGVLGAILGAALLIYSIFSPDAFAGLRALAGDAAAPAGKAAADGREAGKTVFSGIQGYFQAGSRNARLQRELDEAKVRLARADAIAGENERLRALLGLSQQTVKPVAVTELIASTASSTRRFATIGAGRSRGVAVGMPVRTPLGLVGRVLEVGNSTARVLLVTDTESVVPVRRTTDGVPAFAQGRADGTLQIRLINLGINPLKPHDVFVTSGSGGLYRPNTPVAMVVKVTRDGAIARMLSDPAASEFVMVEAMASQLTPPVPEKAPEEGTELP
jgi:rod shape-determining protein MreC